MPNTTRLILPADASMPQRDHHIDNILPPDLSYLRLAALALQLLQHLADAVLHDRLPGTCLLAEQR